MGLDAVAVLAIFIAWILACVLNRFAMILSYTVFTTYDKFKRHVGKINFSAAGLIVIIFLAAYYSNGRNIIEALKLTYGNPLLRWIPIIGWYKGMIMSAVNGQLPPFAGYLFLLLVGMGVFIFLIWQIKADFYEDALSSANKNEGQDGAASASVIKKERSEKISRSGSFGGEGAMVFFTKEMYIRRRLAKFGVVTKTMIFYFFVCAIGSLITLNVFEDSSFFVTGMILLIILFFRNQGNPIAQETGMNWLFLVPDNPYKKVFYAMLAGTVSTAIDILPGLFVSEIILGENILKMILWYITVMAADFMFSASGMLLEAVSSGSALDAVKLIINMALRMAVVVFIVSFMSVGFLIGGRDHGACLYPYINACGGRRNILRLSVFSSPRSLNRYEF
jgi:hypothetical protein